MKNELAIRNLFAREFYGVQGANGEKDMWKGADIEQRETIDRVIRKLKSILEK